MKNLKNKIFLYPLVLIHLPWTIIRFIIASTLLIDAWCDKVINNWLEENKM